MNKSELEARLLSLKKELGSATLVAVTKYSPIEDIVSAYSCGQVDFGENRSTDLKEKADYFFTHNLSDVRWHFIGNLQTNKVKDVLRIPNLWAIHSVGSIHLLEELLKRESEFSGSELKLFFQFNTSHEDEKSGFESTEELLLAIEMLLAKKNSKFVLYGLMTMAAIRTDNVKEAALTSFKELKRIKEYLSKKHGISNLKLSMGMSGDFKEAISEGADYIRIGSLIFK